MDWSSLNWIAVILGFNSDHMKSMKLVIPLHFIWEKNLFSDISRKCILTNMIGAVTVVTTPIIFGKMHFLLLSENEFFHQIECNGMTSFMDFMWSELKPDMTPNSIQTWSIHSYLNWMPILEALGIITETQQPTEWGWHINYSTHSSCSTNLLQWKASLKTGYGN